MSVVRAIHNWRNNAEMMAEVGRLYVQPDDLVLDCTYGQGNFWTVFRPQNLVATDLHRRFSQEGSVDFRKMPWEDEQFDVVVCDPPYAFRGRASKFDERYGVDSYMPWKQRMKMMRQALRECARVTVTGGYILFKCQDQVVNGHVVWQTDKLTSTGKKAGLTKVDRFDLFGKAREQPMKGRRQKHAHGRTSTLLVFQKNRTNT